MHAGADGSTHPSPKAQTMLDKHTWYILKHLHHNVATQQAARIDAGERLTPQAFLVSQPDNQAGQASMNVAEISADFIADLLAKDEGERLLAKYLADALHEGSLIQQQIAQEHGFTACYTLLVQETLLPAEVPEAAPRPALMVLLNGKGMTLPIFHWIETLPGGQRRCHLRAFPELQEIEAVQHMLQARMQQNTTLH